jgi:hypothetical protein
MVCELWLCVHGLFFMVYCFWFVVHYLLLMVYGVLCLVYGAWFMVDSSWSMVHGEGSRFIVHGLWFKFWDSGVVRAPISGTIRKLTFWVSPGIGIGVRKEADARERLPHTGRP